MNLFGTVSSTIFQNFSKLDHSLQVLWSFISVQAVDGAVKFDNLNRKRTRADLVPKGHAEESEEEEVKDAAPVTGVQERSVKIKLLSKMVWTLMINTRINNLAFSISSSIIAWTCIRNQPPQSLFYMLQSWWVMQNTSHVYLNSLKEFTTLKKFGDSLLTKNNRLVELAGQLDEAMADENNKPHRARVEK